MMMNWRWLLIIEDYAVWQAKAREAREQRRAQLTQFHSYIIGLVADNLELDANTVEEFVIDNIKVTASLVSQSLCFVYTPCLINNSQNCFWRNIVKFPPTLIIFGTKMAKTILLCTLHLFTILLNLCQRTTV